MKNRLRTVALIAAVLTMPACQKDFLTEVPSDFVAPENFYRNAGDAVAATNAAYATFINLQSPLSSNDYVGRNFWMVTEYSTEVATSRLSRDNERSVIGNYNTTFTSTHPYMEGIYAAAYAGINRANSVLARVPGVPMDETRKAQLLGEAKFLRALHYYNLAGLFGGVPLKLDETSSIEGAQLARATAAETWAQIAKDLTEAAAVLPPSWTGSDYGRATKGAALTLLGKAYLQSKSQTGDVSANQKALDAFRQVLTLGYKLDPNYASLFNGSNEKSAEIIFSFQNVAVDGQGGRMTEWFAPITSPAIYVGGAQNQFQAERPFYDSYNPNDARKEGTWLTSFNTTFNGAPRTVTWTYATTAIPPTTSNIVNVVNYGSTGPVPRKYLDLASVDGGSESPDVIVLRYADVLLSTAEAINEVSGPTAEAYDFVNQVRARASRSATAQVPPLTAGLSQAQFRDSVFLERRFELALEMHGLFDSRRNWEWSQARIAANIVPGTRNASPFTSNVEKGLASHLENGRIPDKWKLYPIPSRACELNPALTQNPLWPTDACQGLAATP